MRLAGAGDVHNGGIGLRGHRRGLLQGGKARALLLLRLARLLAYLPQHLLRIGPAHPAGKAAGVLALQRLVADLGHNGHRSPQGLEAAFGRVNAEVRDDRADHELEHGDAVRHQVTHRGVTAREAQITRVHAVRGHGDEGLAGELLLALEGAHGGFLAGLVTVEGIDELAVEIGIIQHEAAQYLQVIRAEGGATGSHGSLHARGIHGHDIRIALHHHGLVLFRNVALGQIQPEEHLGLVIEHGFGRVHVLAQLVIVEKLARAETDNVAG